MFAGTKTQIDKYVRGKTWYWYLPVWLFGLWVFTVLVRYDPDNGLPFPINIAQAFDFFLHEMAHIVVAFLPPILVASAGSLSELLLGGLLIWGAFKGKSYFTVLIASLWFMLAAQSAGIYMADARAQKLFLVSLGAALSGSDKALHDWNFVFGKLHILRFDTLIGGTVRVIGVLVGLFGLAFSAWLLYRMAKVKGQPAPMSEGEKELLMAQGGVPAARHGDIQRHDGIYPTPTRGTLFDDPSDKLPPKRPDQ